MTTGYNPGNFSDVEDPVARKELRNLWQVVQSQRAGADKMALASELADLRRRVAAIQNARKKGYRASTIPESEAGPAQEASGGAPSDAPYILMDHNAALPNHRRLQAGTATFLDDSGAGGNATLRMDAIIVIAGRVLRFTILSAFNTVAGNSFGMPAVGGGATSVGHSASRLGQIIRHVHSATPAGAATFGHGGIGASLWMYRGNAAGLGGFHYRHVFGMESISTPSRWFIGCRNLTAAAGAAVDFAATLINCVVIGSFTAAGSADTGVYLYYNDAAGTCTNTATGLTWATGDIFQLDIACDANASSMTVAVVKTDGATGATSSFSTTISSNLPPSTTFMVPVIQVTNAVGGTESLCNIYVGVDQPYGI